MARDERGFTLIELMIVVAIIGVLSGIAIPKFAALIRKSGEGASKGNLGALRSAVSIYYSDMEGLYPADLVALDFRAKYMATIPNARTPNYHSDTSAVLENVNSAGGNDHGGWLYDNILNDSNLGQVNINCTDTDTKGSVWTNY